MTKANIVEEMMSQTSLTRKQAQEAVEAMMQVMTDALISGKNIYLRGFGTYEVKERGAKTARDIRKGERVEVPACKVVRFKPCEELKSLVAMATGKCDTCGLEQSPCKKIYQKDGSTTCVRF